MKSSLSIAYIQYNIQWEDKLANYKYLDALIYANYKGEALIVLPEMFNTGFSMDTTRLAEDENGSAVQWMQNTAAKHETIICGSIIYKSGEDYYNRFLFVDKTGVIAYYDKRHLYTPGLEDQSYKAGVENAIIDIQGWYIMPLICYDLRFPAWSRNTLKGYDILIYVASWPSDRIKHWDHLLAARAIENQCYVLGVNRLGIDGNELTYCGSSAVYDYNGDSMSKAGTKAGYNSVNIKPDHLSYRSKLNFLQDRDIYEIS